MIVLAYRAFGVNDWAPFLLSMVFGSLSIVLADYLLHGVSNPIRRTAYLLLVVLFTPLPILVLTGMEHALQAFLTLAVLYLAATVLSEGGSNSRRIAGMAFLVSLLTITRYEGLFLVASIVVFLALQKRFFAALALGAAGLAAVTAYGLISVLHGWYFIPNSVLLKGASLSFTLEGLLIFAMRLSTNLVDAPHVLILVFACLAAFMLAKRQQIIGKREGYLVALFVPAVMLHMQLASIGWFYRYEAYIVLIGLVILAGMADALFTTQVDAFKTAGLGNLAATAVLFLLLAAPLAVRMSAALVQYPIAVKNIYDQQYQMGLFLQRYYSGKVVVLNDIGAPDYLAELRVLDLYGLDSMDVARAKLSGTFGERTIQELAASQDPEIAIVYDDWFKGQIPPDWVQVGKWSIDENSAAANPTVTIYAPGTQWKQVAIDNLKDFSTLLPSDVLQEGLYTQPQAAIGHERRYCLVASIATCCDDLAQFVE